MTLRTSIFKKVFRFNFEARTSRGRMRDKTSWFIKVWRKDMPEIYGVGECGPLPGLSPDATPDFEDILAAVVNDLSHIDVDPLDMSILEKLEEIIPPQCPAIRFGLETAALDLLTGGKRIIFNNNFANGKPIPINGLIWMGDPDFMMDQIRKKISSGFKCIKIKVGSLDFDAECSLLEFIRDRYSPSEVTLRLDANGAFEAQNAMTKLERLSRFEIHSIEQPVIPGSPVMAYLCRNSPIPIALDESLIGLESLADKAELLQALQPAYIILKPTLHGGFRGCREWIGISETLGIPWWVTSALESNIGLNAICQFTAEYNIVLPQGLGTGAIYENNIASPLRVRRGEIFHRPDIGWTLDDEPSR